MCVCVDVVDTCLFAFSPAGVQVVSFDDWQAMDRIEVQRGQVIGKPREKITSVEEMLQIAREQRYGGLVPLVLTTLYTFCSFHVKYKLR